MFFLGISEYYHDASVALMDSSGSLIDFKKELEQKKDIWCRKTKNDKACKLKYMSVYLRPTYKTIIPNLMENKNYCLTL